MKKIIGFISIIIIIMGCVGGASPAANSNGTSLDMAIAETAGRMETRMNEGTKVALINFSSSSTQLSEYILEGISLHLVNSGKLVVVDRANLDRIRQEQGFQLSGEVSDESAKAIGQMLGADAIVTGSLIQIGREYRINLKAISVEAATVVVQYATDIIADERVRTLLASGGGSGGGTQTTSARTTGSGTSGTAGTSGTSGGTGSRVAPTITSVTVNPDTVSVDKGKTHQFEASISGTNNPDLTVTWSVTGNLSRRTTINEDGFLTVADDETATPLVVIATSTVDQSKNGRATVTIPGGIAAMNLNNVSTWNSSVNAIRNGGNNQTYIINVTGNVSVPAPPSNENIFGSVTGITVTIQGSGTLSTSVSGCLLQIGAGQTVVLSNVTLRGRSDNNSAIVRIMSGGIFRMEGSASVTGNTNRSNDNGSGVLVNGGTFIMQDRSSVTGNNNSNIGNSGGAGVRVSSGTFIMRNGTISGNTNWASGGVYVNSGGTFTMENGTISGNTSTTNYGGGGVYIAGGTFTMENGTISGNTSSSNSGGGVYLNRGTFIMRGGMITGGNNTRGNGGGVYVKGGTFTKTGGTVSGSDVSFSDRNIAQGQGHAVYLDGNYSGPDRWRNFTAGPNDNSADYGFWLND